MPWLRRTRAVTSLLLPAPTSITRRSASEPSASRASSTAAEETDTPDRAIPVPARTRRPAPSASRIRRSRSGPHAPASRASSWARRS